MVRVSVILASGNALLESAVFEPADDIGLLIEQAGAKLRESSGSLGAVQVLLSSSGEVMDSGRTFAEAGINDGDALTVVARQVVGSRALVTKSRTSAIETREWYLWNGIDGKPPKDGYRTEMHVEEREGTIILHDPSDLLLEYKVEFECEWCTDWFSHDQLKLL